MARPREFDEDEVLAAAMNCFWARGYEASSIRDLADEMGITGASLYNAFGDKRTLYHRALEFYIDHSVRDRIERLERLEPLRAIGTFFDEVVSRSVADRQRRGCMLVNAALEVAADDTELRALVARHTAKIEGFFKRCIAAGQTDGSIARAQPAADLAKTMLGVLFGLRVLARVRPQRNVLEGAVRGALGLLAEPGR
jgi:TetR/AcrR family transcriptional repressor of nem operon